jgi:hypothetical protein
MAGGASRAAGRGRATGRGGLQVGAADRVRSAGRGGASSVVPQAAVSAVPEKAGAKTVSDLSRTGRAGPWPGRAGSVSNAAAASPMVGGVLTSRPARARIVPSALSDFVVHQAGTKLLIPAGKMCDECKVNAAQVPDNDLWMCNACQFKEPE